MTADPTHIVLFTSQDIGFELVQYFAERLDVKTLVVTMRSKRDEINGYRSPIDACVTNGIPHLVTSRVTESTFKAVEAHRPHLIISAYYPIVIPSDIVALSERGAINVHPGKLPYYRGRFPTPWYILNGDSHFGVSIHQVDRGIDTGPVLVQKTFPIHDGETGHSLYRRAMSEGAAMLIESFDDLLEGKIQPTPQIGTGSYYSAIERRFHIDWNATRADIARRVRVHATPYFPTFSYLFNRMISVNRVSAIDPPGYSTQGGGKIVEVLPDGRFVVSCCDGCLRVEEYYVTPPFAPGEQQLHIRPGNQLD
jgi:methionyl-tRNA formyltransferase